MAKKKKQWKKKRAKKKVKKKAWRLDDKNFSKLEKEQTWVQHLIRSFLKDFIKLSYIYHKETIRICFEFEFETVWEEGIEPTGIDVESIPLYKAYDQIQRVVDERYEDHKNRIHEYNDRIEDFAKKNGLHSSQVYDKLIEYEKLFRGKNLPPFDPSISPSEY